jgi:hypothetical protein
MGAATASGGGALCRGAGRFPIRLKKYTAAAIKMTHKSKRTMVTRYLNKEGPV